MGKALSVTSLLTKKHKLFPFQGKWEQSFGQIGQNDTMLIWGQSGSGKTSLAIQLCKYISQFTRVVYNSLEEGYGPTLANKFRNHGMDEVKRRVIVVKESMEELSERLSRQKSPQVAFIDSLQYTGMNYRDYVLFKEKHHNKLLIFVSHADGKEPATRTAKSVRYDVGIKVFCEGYKAFIVSRYSHGEPFIIWEEGANDYWNDKI